MIYLDITNKELVKKILKSTTPDILINTAAITNTNYCETHKKRAYEVNVEGVRNLVEFFRGSKFIQISTDYVFDGKKGKYKKKEKPNPINFYGLTKLKGENIIQNSGIDYLPAPINRFPKIYKSFDPQTKIST